MKKLLIGICLGIFIIFSQSNIVFAENIVEVGKPISFVACPVVRDTKTVPCWLASYQGQTYYLGVQQDIGADWYPPQLKHEVLVEGTVGSNSLCGGIVIENIKTSVLPELNLACNTVLPAMETILAPLAERGPGPKDEENSAQRRQPPPTPKPPYKNKTFNVYYDFDNTQLYSREFTRLREAINYAKASQATAIEVRAYRGSSLLSNGKVLVEQQHFVQQRAEAIEEWLRLAELDEKTEIKVQVEKLPAGGQGENDYTSRRVSIEVSP